MIERIFCKTFFFCTQFNYSVDWIGSLLEKKSMLYIHIYHIGLLLKVIIHMGANLFYKCSRKSECMNGFHKL